MKIKVWANTSPYEVLDTVEAAELYKEGDTCPHGLVMAVLPSTIFGEPGIDQSILVDSAARPVAVPPEDRLPKSATDYNKITFYPIYASGRHPWDKGALSKPVYPIMNGVTIEDVSSMITRETFSLWKTDCMLSKQQVEALENIRYALVHRYRAGQSRAPDVEKHSQRLIGKLTICLLLVRPMRRREAGIVTGIIRENGKFEAQGFNISEPVEVPHVQKWFYFRERDVEVFRSVVPEFLKAVDENSDSYYPLRMALQFFEEGHINDKWWKVRHILWWSALEALFGNDSKTLIIRVLSLLGNKDLSAGQGVSIYDSGDIPSFTGYKPHVSVGDTLDDIYEIRNMVAHGRRVPNEFLTPVQHIIRNAHGRVEILAEAESFIIRRALIYIFSNSLIRHFRDVDTRESYWLHTFGINRRQAHKKLEELRVKQRIEKAAVAGENQDKTTPAATNTERQAREARRAAAKATQIRRLPQ